MPFCRHGLDCPAWMRQTRIAQEIPAGHFSSLLKHWRNVRRLTQIELAADANVSAKHLCFLETGRSQPSREMVQLLGSALDLPLEERNALHVAAGFVPPYGDKGLAAENLQPVRQALDFILRQQEPYPGIVDRRALGRSHAQSGVGAPAEAVSRFIRDGKRACRQRHARRFPSQGPAAVHVELGRVRPAR